MTQSIRFGVLTLNRLLALRGITRPALVNPYIAVIHRRIIDNYWAIAVEVAAMRRLGIRVSHDFALVAPGRLRALVGEVAEAGPQAIAAFCGNLRAAPPPESVEAELGIRLLDTVNTTGWGQLRAVGAIAAKVREWGHLFGWR